MRWWYFVECAQAPGSRARDTCVPPSQISTLELGIPIPYQACTKPCYRYLVTEDNVGTLHQETPT